MNKWARKLFKVNKGIEEDEINKVAGKYCLEILLNYLEEIKRHMKYIKVLVNGWI